jgi:hypothetical protein
MLMAFRRTPIWIIGDEQLTVGKQLDEVVACESCEYRYPIIRGFCPMCGVPAPKLEHTSLNLETTSRGETPGFSERSHSANDPAAMRTVSVTSYRTGGLRPKSRIAMVIFAATASLVLLLLWRVSGSKLPNSKQSNSKPSVPATTPSAIPELEGTEGSTPASAATKKRAASSPVSPSARQLQPSAENELKSASDTSAADDPQELWKKMSKGSTHAEVALALLYLDGNKVAKNCEEAAVLLTAASRRGSTKAKSLLEKHYAERCP